MIRKLTAIFLAFFIMVDLTGCGGKQKKRYEATFIELFDTTSQIVAYMDSREEFTKYSQLIYDSLREYHQLYDIYHDYEGINNIKTINDNAGKKPVKVDRRIIDLLLFSKEAYEKTGGKINVALGPVLKIWHQYRIQGVDNPESAAVPGIEELKEAAGHTDINKVIIDEENSTVFLEDPEMSLDVGAVAKGYAVEQVAKIALENGFTSGLISVGGNIRAIGNKGYQDVPWNLGIQNPFKFGKVSDEQVPENHDKEESGTDSDADGDALSGDGPGYGNLSSGNVTPSGMDKGLDDSVIAIVYLTDMSLVTSGDYERYYVVDGKRYHHIIDPGTLFPSEYFSSVTIICRDSGMADALSTAVFNMPFEEGLDLINRLPDTEAMWVMKNGEIRYSSGFHKYTKKK